MLYSCYQCQAKLRVPEEIDLKSQTTPVLLRCPNCHSTTSLSFNNQNKKELEIQPFARTITRLLKLIQNSFIGHILDDLNRGEKLSFLKDSLVSLLRERAFTSFNLLILIYQLFLAMGIWHLSSTFGHSLTVQLIGSICGFILAIIFLVVYKQLIGNYLHVLMCQREKSFFEYILNGNIIFYLFFVIQFSFAFIHNHLGHILVNANLNQMLYIWIACYVFIALCFILFFIIRHHSYIYAILTFTLGLFFHDTIAYVLDHYLGSYGYGLALTPILEVILGQQNNTIALAGLYLGLGPLLALATTRSVKYFTPDLYTPFFQKNSFRYMSSFYVLLPLAGIATDIVWENVTWSIICGFIFIFFCLRGLSPWRRMSFGVYVIFGLYHAVMTVNLARWSYQWFIYFIMVLSLVVAIIPNIYFRAKSNLNEAIVENEINFDLPYIQRASFAWQSIMIIALIIAGFYSLTVDNVFYHSWAFTVIFFCIVLLYFNFYRISVLAKFLPWLIIFAACYFILEYNLLQYYGIFAFAVAFAALIISFIWKVYLARPYNRRLAALFPVNMQQEDQEDNLN